LLKENPDVRSRVRGSCEVDRLIRIASRILPAGVKARLRRGTARAPVPAGAAPTRSAPDEAPIRPLTPAEAEFFAARTRFRIDKAQRLLGYRPAFDFE